MQRALIYHSSTSKRKKSYRSLLFALVNSTETESIVREVFQSNISSECKQFARLPHISLLVFRHRSSDSRLVRQPVLQWLFSTHWRRQQGTFRRRSTWIFGKGDKSNSSRNLSVVDPEHLHSFCLFTHIDFWKDKFTAEANGPCLVKANILFFSPHLTSRGLEKPIRKNRSSGERLEKQKQWCDYWWKFFSPRARMCIAL